MICDKRNFRLHNITNVIYSSAVSIFCTRAAVWHLQALLNKLQQQLPSLTPKLRQAGKLVLDKPTAVATTSMRELARDAGVTPPTMARLASTLGYESYADFKAVFRDALDDFDFEQRASQLQSTSELNGEAAVIDSMQRAAHHNVGLCFGQLQAPAVCEAADLMIAAQNVYLVAASAPHWIAAYTQYVGKMAVPNMRVPRSSGEGLIDNLIPVGKKDVVLAMSFNPYARQTRDAIEFAVTRGAKLIYLTDSLAAPQSEKADVLLKLSTDSPQFFPSMVPVVAALETLLAVTVARSGPAAVKAIADYAKLRQGGYVQT